MVDVLVFFILPALLTAGNVIHDSFLGNMGSRGRTTFDFSSLAFRSSNTLPVLGMSLIDGGGIDVFVVIRLETKESLVLGELVPMPATTGLFQTAIGCVTGVGHPRLEHPLVAKPVVRDC